MLRRLSPDRVPALRPLARSKNFLLGHAYETVVLLRPADGAAWEVGEHHGDPTCGLIGPGEQWFVTGGQGLLFADFARGVRPFLRGADAHVRQLRSPAAPDLVDCAVHAMRLEPPDGVRVLLDPWSVYASTWVLDTTTLALTRLREGPSLAGEPYREEVEF